jgi:hypothetical protein
MHGDDGAYLDVKGLLGGRMRAAKARGDLTTLNLPKREYKRKINREGHEFHSCRFKLLFVSGFSR